MNEELINSIAARAPHMKPNDTVFVSRDLWWTVVSEEKSSEAQLVSTGGPTADSLVWYGTGQRCQKYFIFTFLFLSRLNFLVL